MPGYRLGRSEKRDMPALPLRHDIAVFQNGEKDPQKDQKHKDLDREHYRIFHKALDKKVVIPFAEQNLAPERPKPHMDPEIDHQLAKENPHDGNPAPVKEDPVNKKLQHGRQGVAGKKDGGRHHQEADQIVCHPGGQADDGAEHHGAEGQHHKSERDMKVHSDRDGNRAQHRAKRDRQPGKYERPKIPELGRCGSPVFRCKNGENIVFRHKKSSLLWQKLNAT
ncbi:protein of unknown function [Ruminococcaceae bacterium BL-6]|nr:protein of unknown function [Ruminococcaceae bacterium BL-6]